MQRAVEGMNDGVAKKSANSQMMQGRPTNDIIAITQTLYAE
jgi:hypothetical protein